MKNYILILSVPLFFPLVANNAEKEAALGRAKQTWALLTAIEQQIQQDCPDLSPREQAILKNEMLRELSGVMAPEIIAQTLQRMILLNLEQKHQEREQDLWQKMSNTPWSRDE